jgi:hypothetical protein
MTSDTNLNWVLIRIRANALVPVGDATSVSTIQNSVVEKFALSTLGEFEANHHQPIYFKPGRYHPTPAEQQQAQLWHSAPTKAVAFFKQLGQSLSLSPLPTRKTGLHGIPLRTLPPWVMAQAGAQPWPATGPAKGKKPKRFRNPSFGQRSWLARFKPIGLTANGFKIPRGFRSRHLAALQAGMVAGNKQLNHLLDTVNVSRRTNYWSYLNDGVGTYANTPGGYQLRGFIVLAGGSANMPQDAVYAQANSLDGTDATQLVGDDTYTLTFRPPPGPGVLDLPAVGGLPPTDDSCDGEPCGFWSIHAYQTDTKESSAPFITQPSALNTAYSKANLAVTGVDTATDTLTVRVSQPVQ